MVKQFDSKIVGAFLIGIGIVGGAFTINSMSQSNAVLIEDNALATVNEAPQRNLISVQDSNNDGLEDWQEEFLSADKIIISSSSEEYEPPTTVTGQMGVSLIHKLLSSKIYAPLGSSQEEIVEDLASTVEKYGKDNMYDQRDITTTKDTSSESIRTYGNSLALAVINNALQDTETELVILQRYVQNQSPENIEKLNKLASMYENTLKDTLNTPVPQIFIKEHLDLINVYNAMYNDVKNMAKIEDDPVLALIRLQRYEDDATGLRLALENLYEALEPHVDAFQTDDPAVIFVRFSPNYNTQ